MGGQDTHTHAHTHTHTHTHTQSDHFFKSLKMWEEEIAILFEIAVICFQIFIARRLCIKRPSDDDVITKKHELQKNIIKINIAFNVLKLFELSE